jgi:acylphosphatase
MIRHLQFVIKGKVENKGFRLYALWGASECNIKGEARQFEGKIIVEAEGLQSDLNRFTEWCKKGPAGSVIESFEINNLVVLDYQDFKIL